MEIQKKFLSFWSKVKTIDIFALTFVLESLMLFYGDFGMNS
jgi:hypothetical protein